MKARVYGEVLCLTRFVSKESRCYSKQKQESAGKDTAKSPTLGNQELKFPNP